MSAKSGILMLENATLVFVGVLRNVYNFKDLVYQDCKMIFSMVTPSNRG